MGKVLKIFNQTVGGRGRGKKKKKHINSIEFLGTAQQKKCCKHCVFTRSILSVFVKYTIKTLKTTEDFKNNPPCPTKQIHKCPDIINKTLGRGTVTLFTYSSLLLNHPVSKSPKRVSQCLMISESFQNVYFPFCLISHICCYCPLVM